MCAILDANASWEVFGDDGTEAVRKFFDWLNSGRGVLVVGGKLWEELGQNTNMQEWARQAILSGRINVKDNRQVSMQAAHVSQSGSVESNDPHMLALAQVGGARLLYSNDEALQRDFKKKALIDNPRGKIYSTRATKSFGSSHRGLLVRRGLCRRVR